MKRVHQVFCKKCNCLHTHFTSNKKAPSTGFGCDESISHEAWAVVKYQEEMHDWVKFNERLKKTAEADRIKETIRI